MKGDKDVIALTAVPTTKDHASAMDEYHSREDVTQNTQEGLRLTILRDETKGNEQHQPEQPFQ